MKTAINILEEYQKEIEKHFLIINEDLLEQTKKELANCKEEEVSELKAKLRLLNDYLHRNIKGTKWRLNLQSNTN